MKIVYFGSDVFLSCFEYFVSNHQVLALYTYHNDEDFFTEYAIKKRAESLGIPVFYESITKERILDYIGEGCGLFFSAEYNRILPVPEGEPRFFGINIHSSLLPEGRSYYPIEAAMERGLSVTGVTAHKLQPELDRGDILGSRTIRITPDMDSVDVYMRSGIYARELLEEIMGNLEAAWERAVPQTWKKPYWRRPENSLLTLRHDLTRAQAKDMFRRYNSMTQVLAENVWYYVTSLEDGSASMAEEIRMLDAGRMLYRLADGHLRLHVHPKTDKQGGG